MKLRLVVDVSKIPPGAINLIQSGAAWYIKASEGSGFPGTLPIANPVALIKGKRCMAAYEADPFVSTYAVDSLQKLWRWLKQREIPYKLTLVET